MQGKRWRYRKVTPEIIEEMKALREQGCSFAKIGKKYNLNPRTVKYWIDPKERAKVIERAKKSKVKQVLSKEQKAKQKEYIRNYIRERYRSDPEFRERFLKHTKNWQKRKKENA